MGELITLCICLVVMYQCSPRPPVFVERSTQGEIADFLRAARSARSAQ
jgi:hypothetical protein